MLALIKRFEVNMRCSLINFVLFDVQILLILIDVLHLGLVGDEKAGVVEAAQTCSEVVVDAEISVEIAVCEVNVD